MKEKGNIAWWLRVKREDADISYLEFKILTLSLTAYICGLVILNLSVFIWKIGLIIEILT